MLYPRNLKGHPPSLDENIVVQHEQGLERRDAETKWIQISVHNESLSCASQQQDCAHTICLGEVSMKFTNCLAGFKNDRAMGPTAQYKPGLATVSARHFLRMSEFFFTRSYIRVLFRCDEETKSCETVNQSHQKPPLPFLQDAQNRDALEQ